MRAFAQALSHTVLVCDNPMCQIDIIMTFFPVICSCCRVGDGDSAAYLFEKMITMPNFRPRATPYNTLIQYYCQNEPNREKALFYYEALLAADVSASGNKLEENGSVNCP